MLYSFEELCITLAVADNSFARVLNPHGFTRRTLEAGIETRQTLR